MSPRSSEWDDVPTQPEAYVSIKEISEGYEQLIYLPRRWREIAEEQERDE
jgi:hypothetical protein